jgi:uncharacterized membrane protein
MEAIGPVLLLLSIPLMLRWVPRNRFFGLRVPATLRTETVWYDANALCARHLFLLGLLLVILELLLPVSMRIQVLGLVATVGFFAIIVVDWRTANRWDRDARQRRNVVPPGTN